MKHSKEKEKCFQTGVWRRLMVIGIVFSMLIAVLLSPSAGRTMTAQAATAITSMSHFSPADGPIIANSGVDKASFGFVMPVFNGGNATWEEVASDLTVRVKINGNWMDIDSSGIFTYNKNWGHWSDSGFYGYWFTVSQTTYIQLASKSRGVTLDYTLEFTNIHKTTITSMTATQGPQITAGVTGGAGFTYPVFNGDTSIPYSAVAEDIKVYVKPVNNSEWIDIDNNAASGWIYDYNFGQFTDGGGGYWFTVGESIHVKLQSKTSGAALIYTITYNEPVRNSYVLTSYDGTNYKAGDNGAIGVPLPKIDGNAAVKSELGNFVYEIQVNEAWVDLSDTSKSSFQYSGNGYNQRSAANQWGYWVDHIYGLWFQPIQTDMVLRIGYPLNGQKGGAIGNNYITYTFIGNPNAPRPDSSDMEDIELGTSENSHIKGMNLIWSDEFNGTSLNANAWNYDIGYYLNDDPNTWGWGNNELEHYTNSERNVYVRNGSLHITALEEPKSFPQNPNRYAPYSSGKITTKDKFTFRYGRIDFRAKLPRGNGLWPALWLLPNDNVYGTWAASGEIDVMEARGRVPGASSGAIHYGGQWPANTYLGGDYLFPEGQTIDSEYHVYSLVWEEDIIKWYVDGKCFFKATSEQWFSNAAPGNPLAPFDQEFYIIMNLAVGGWFDGGVVPSPGDIPATMQVDYVRVYKEGGSGNPGSIPVTGVTLNQTMAEVNVSESLQLNASVFPVNASNKAVNWTVANNSIAAVDQTGKVTGVSKGTTVVTVTAEDGSKTAQCQITVKEGGSSVIVIGDSVRGLKKIGNNLEFYVNGAEFADLHYRLNNGIQMNVAMNSSGNRNYKYPLNQLKQGDVIEYFFTYNPGGGALDTPVYTYIHGVTQ
ncbi:hypothetical protein acsn021_18710 [Anaerocolumna cellulosilytica]|uniref:Uncharacterized protein n=1 Tax=Anaerocolumna cellulosilytica TaxID=433286 RepID=A0A6S6R491_9FIRM|nr:family 16 glycosylhydrolase [Anaerocolumna cellulosilytica]MBB5194735.1 beta-glucanase (GH16 family) [Anaerocolumna cellulosilytica]BCJ94302.1 hypothetical protein acsn021_18710 [Anaerocolumna cellulosilytica]